MSYDRHWPRWIKASLFEYFRTTQVWQPELLYIEGQERKTNTEAAWFELRMDGPWSTQGTGNLWRHEIEVNVICSCNVDDDLYHVDRMLGAAARALCSSIPVFKYGDGPDDDPAVQLGCLSVAVQDGKIVWIHYYGQIEPKIKLIQATVEVRYWIELEGD